MGLWDSLIIWMRGESIAVLGPRGSGKTVLLSILLKRNDRQGGEATVGPERTEGLRNKALGLDIKKGLDLPGAERAYPDWQRQFALSTKIFYLFDSHLLRTDEDYARRVTEDGKMMKMWGPGGKGVFLLGTHADTDPMRRELGAARYNDLISDLDPVILLQGRCKSKGMEIGSLLDDNDAMTLLKRLLKV